MGRRLTQMDARMDADTNRLNGVTKTVIGCAYHVSDGLGCGFLEKVYENALAHELRNAGLGVEQQKRFNIIYGGVQVGEYVADLIVEREVIVETKATRVLEDIHAAQCLNYLKATGLRLGLVLNFGTARVSVRRIVNRF